MSTYQKCDPSVKLMANEILHQYETHKPLINARVTIDFVFAYGERDDVGNLKTNAIMHHGHAAGGLCRKISLKDRAKGMADAEILLDGDNWKEMTEPEQKALLDHELHHIAVKIDERGVLLDDLKRPILQLRKHDVEIGWFKEIAARHGDAAPERLQARQIMLDYGQYFWPDIAPPVELYTPENTSITLRTAGKEVTLNAKDAEKMVRKSAAGLAGLVGKKTGITSMTIISGKSRVKIDAKAAKNIRAAAERD